MVLSQVSRYLFGSAASNVNSFPKPLFRAETNEPPDDVTENVKNKLSEDSFLKFGETKLYDKIKEYIDSKYPDNAEQYKNHFTKRKLTQMRMDVINEKVIPSKEDIEKAIQGLFEEKNIPAGAAVEDYQEAIKSVWGSGLKFKKAVSAKLGFGDETRTAVLSALDKRFKDALTLAITNRAKMNSLPTADAAFQDLYPYVVADPTLPDDLPKFKKTIRDVFPRYEIDLRSEELGNLVTKVQRNFKDNQLSSLLRRSSLTMSAYEKPAPDNMMVNAPLWDTYVNIDGFPVGWAWNPPVPAPDGFDAEAFREKVLGQNPSEKTFQGDLEALGYTKIPDNIDEQTEETLQAHRNFLDNFTVELDRLGNERQENVVILPFSRKVKTQILKPINEKLNSFPPGVKTSAPLPPITPKPQEETRIEVDVLQSNTLEKAKQKRQFIPFNKQQWERLVLIPNVHRVGEWRYEEKETNEFGITFGDYLFEDIKSVKSDVKKEMERALKTHMNDLDWLNSEQLEFYENALNSAILKARQGKRKFQKFEADKLSYRLRCAQNPYFREFKQGDSDGILEADWKVFIGDETYNIFKEVFLNEPAFSNITMDEYMQRVTDHVSQENFRSLEKVLNTLRAEEPKKSTEAARELISRIEKIVEKKNEEFLQAAERMVDAAAFQSPTRVPAATPARRMRTLSAESEGVASLTPTLSADALKEMPEFTTDEYVVEGLALLGMLTHDEYKDIIKEAAQREKGYTIDENGALSQLFEKYIPAPPATEETVDGIMTKLPPGLSQKNIEKITAEFRTLYRNDNTIHRHAHQLMSDIIRYILTRCEARNEELRNQLQSLLQNARGPVIDDGNLSDDTRKKLFDIMKTMQEKKKLLKTLTDDFAFTPTIAKMPDPTSSLHKTVLVVPSYAGHENFEKISHWATFDIEFDGQYIIKLTLFDGNGVANPANPDGATVKDAGVYKDGDWDSPQADILQKLVDHVEQGDLAFGSYSERFFFIPFTFYENKIRETGSKIVINYNNKQQLDYMMRLLLTEREDYISATEGALKMWNTANSAFQKLRSDVEEYKKGIIEAVMEHNQVIEDWKTDFSTDGIDALISELENGKIEMVDSLSTTRLKDAIAKLEDQIQLEGDMTKQQPLLDEKKELEQKLETLDPKPAPARNAVEGTPALQRQTTAASMTNMDGFMSPVASDTEPAFDTSALPVAQTPDAAAATPPVPQEMNRMMQRM